MLQSTAVTTTWRKTLHEEVKRDDSKKCEYNSIYTLNSFQSSRPFVKMLSLTKQL